MHIRGLYPDVITEDLDYECVTGELFESGNERQLTDKIDKLWKDAETAERYAEGCRNKKFITLEEYTREMVGIYNGVETVLELN